VSAAPALRQQLPLAETDLAAITAKQRLCEGGFLLFARTTKIAVMSIEGPWRPPDGQRVSTRWVASSVGTTSVTR
jgi:hypothetical protein